MAAVNFVEVCMEESPIAEYSNAGVSPTRLATEKLYLPARSARLGPNPSHLDRGDELRGIPGAVPRLIDALDPDGSLSVRAYLKDLVWLLSLCGYVGTPTVGVAGGTDEIQTITVTGTPAGGTYTLTFAGVGVGATSHTTAPIVYNASAAVVQAALEALPNIGTGNVVCAGGPHPGTPVTVTFSVTLGKRNVPLLTADSTGLTGGTSPTVTPSTTTPGVAGAVSDPDGATVPAAVYKWVFTKLDQINAQTAQIRTNYKNPAVLLKGNGYAISSITLPMSGELSADMMGLVLRRLAVDTSTVPAVTSAAIPPIRRGDLFLSGISGGGRIADFTLTINNPIERVHAPSQDPPSNYPDAMEYTEAYPSITGSIPKRVLAAADIDALIAATTFAASARWRTPKVIGATTAKYTMWVEMPAAQYVGGGPDELTNARRAGASFDFFSAYDESSAHDGKITILTDVATIASYA